MTVRAAACALLLLPALARADYKAHLVCITDDGKPITDGAKRPPDRDVSCDIAVDKGDDVSDSMLYSIGLQAEPRLPFPVRGAAISHKLRRGSSPTLRYVDDAVFAHGKDFPRCADLVITGFVIGEKHDLWRKSLTLRSACPLPKVSAELRCEPKGPPGTTQTCRVSIPHDLHPAAQAEFFVETADTLITGKQIVAPFIEDDGHDPAAHAKAELEVTFDPDPAHKCAARTIRAAITQDGAIAWTGKTRVHPVGCR